MSSTADTARDMLLWMNDNGGSEMIVTGGFLSDDPDTLDTEQKKLLVKVCRRLESAGLIEGLYFDQENYPIRVRLTPDGHRCIDDFAGDVRRWEERNVPNIDKSINVNTGGGASQLAAHVSGDVTQNQTIEGIDVEKLKHAAEITRDSLPVLGLPEEDAQQARAAAEEIVAEAAREQPDQGLMAKAGEKLRAVLSNAKTGLTLVPVIMEALTAAGIVG